MSRSIRRLSRLSAVTAVGAVVTSGLLLASAPSAHAAVTVHFVRGDQVDTSETRAKGHNDFTANGVHITTDASACTDPNPAGGTYCANKAAGYFDVDKPLADVGEPSMLWTQISGSLPPGLQLRVDFDNDGNIDGTLVGETVYNGNWWLPEGTADQFVKNAAPQVGGGGGTYNGPLSAWRAAFPHAQVFTSGWSLGSGVEAEGTLGRITLGNDRYFFTASGTPSSTTIYRSQVDTQYTRTKGHNVFPPSGGIHVTTDAPADGQSKAAGYWSTDIPLTDSGAFSGLDFTLASGFAPGLQLVTDFDNDGTADGTLVSESGWPGIYWLSANKLNGTPVAVWLKDLAPRKPGGAEPTIPGYSAGGGTPAEWRVDFPNARIKQVGYSLGSGAVGDGLLNKAVVGLKEFTFAANRAPVADDKTASVNSGSSVDVTLTATDADGDALTYSSSDPGVTVVGTTLTYTASANAPTGDVVVHYTVKDPDNASDIGDVTIHVTHLNRAPVADDKTASVNSGSSVNVTLTATDADGDALTYSSTDPGVTVVGATLTYAASANAPTGDVVVHYTVKDPSNASDTGDVTIHVTHVNRAPVTGNPAAATTAGGTVTVTLAATDADGDAITYSSTDPSATVVGNQLTYKAPADFVGTKNVAFSATDTHSAIGTGAVTITVNKATSSTTLTIVPGKITTKSKHVRAKVSVTSAGVLTAGTVDLFDGATKVGTGVVDASGNVEIALTKKLKKGTHTFKAVYNGNAATATSEASVTVKVKKKKK